MGLILVLVFNHYTFAQTKGLIVEPARTGTVAPHINHGKPVLDPDLDGYISKKTAGVQRGFQTNDTTESEIPYKPFPLPGKEPMEDLARGPRQGFSDFADVPGTKVYPVSSYLSPAGNFMFRFRLGGIAPNSKGYSILVDADGKFGFSGVNADPQASVDNPGFEFEILLATNFAVRLYDINNATGTATQIGTDAELPYNTYAQKGIAYFENAGADYFYDFYIPFSKITAYFNGSSSLRPLVTTSTPLRMVANTIMAPQSVIKGPISDISGIDDRAYSNPAAAWEKLVNGFVAKAPDGTTTTYYQSFRSDAPVITSTSLVAGTGKTISGTSSEAAGTIIKIYRNGVYLGQTTVQAGGTWTYPATGTMTLTTNERYTATATFTGESESAFSNEVIVGTNCTYSTAPVLGTCTGVKGIDGTVPGAAAGTVIKIYDAKNPGVVFATVTTGGTGASSISATNPGSAFMFKYNNNYNNCNSGANDMPLGSYYVTATEAGKCESARTATSSSTCFGSAITYNLTLSTSPVLQSTTTLSGNVINGASVFVYVGGQYVGRATVTNGTTNATWTISNLVLRSGQTVQVEAVSGTSCSASITANVVNPSNPPIVNSPIRTNATTISGTSTEANGSVITIYLNGTPITGDVTSSTTTVTNGTWSFAKPAAVTLAVGSAITATATATGKTESPVSNSVAVTAIPPAVPALPNITGGPYLEGGTTVSGTGPANTPINVYIDGYLIGTVTSPTTTWTLNLTTAAPAGTHNNDLYAGGYLNATSGTIGSNESAYSNNTTGTYVIVQCNPPAIRTASLTNPQVCSGSATEFRLTGSQAGVIYTLMNGSTERGPSVLGTGDASPAYVSVISFPLTSSTSSPVTETFTIVAKSITGGTCTPTTMTLNPSANPPGVVTINPAPNTGLNVTAPASVAPGGTANVVVENSQLNYRYQLREGTTNIGGIVSGNGGNIYLPTGAINELKTFNVLATDVTRSTNCTAQLTRTVTINTDAPVAPLPVALVSFTGKLVNDLAVLDWATAIEKDNDHFMVERSLNGKEFTQIGKVKGNLNSSQWQTYSFTDMEPVSSLQYYRLKQVDLDGTFEYSKVIALDSKLNRKTEPILYPNPASRNASVLVESKMAETVTLAVYDAVGNLLTQKSVTLKTGSNLLPVETKDLPAGMYLIKVGGKEMNATLKLQKVSE
ncbi:T9SS type A sorting domain-containing protein [Adhaeribacter soli]|nr:T9SS type A sorting domain-containing protein [Adhaeribacter soli]